ncbi:MAG: DsbA family protein [Gemmatimonadota bacterium]|nr:MAG: DsbA family protein [Gemmatimonadota bacterium]
MANSQTRFYGVLAVIFVAGAALIGYVVVKNQPASAGLAEEAIPALASGELVSEEVGVSRGNTEAAVVIEEYADYQCGYCGMVATLTIPQILENYVDTGKARFVFHDFWLGSPVALLGAQAARCAGDQDAFWAMHKVLMSRQREWGGERDPGAKFREYAEALGLDGRAIEECVDSGQYEQIVLSGRLRAQQLGLESTPTFIVNGRRHVGALGYDQLAAVVEEELAKAAATE